MNLKSPARRAVLFILLATIFVLKLNSADIRWNWYGEFPGVKAFRYQLNGQNPNGWIVLDASSRTVVTSGAPDDECSTLYLEQTEDGAIWHETFVMSYLPDGAEENVSKLNEAGPEEGIAEGIIPDDSGPANRWGFKAVLAPYSMGMVDFYNGHDIKDARYFTTTKYGARADAELFLDIRKHMSLNLDAGYRFALKRETVIPGGEDMHFVSLAIGIDGIVPVNDNVRLHAGLSAGAMICFNAGLWDILPVMGATVGADIDLSEDISIGFETGAEVSYGHDRDPLYRSISTYLDVLKATVSYRF